MWRCDCSAGCFEAPNHRPVGRSRFHGAWFAFDIAPRLRFGRATSQPRHRQPGLPADTDARRLRRQPPGKAPYFCTRCGLWRTKSWLVGELSVYFRLIETPSLAERLANGSQHGERQSETIREIVSAEPAGRRNFLFQSPITH